MSYDEWHWSRTNGQSTPFSPVLAGKRSTAGNLHGGGDYFPRSRELFLPIRVRPALQGQNRHDTEQKLDHKEDLKPVQAELGSRRLADIVRRQPTESLRAAHVRQRHDLVRDFTLRCLRPAAVLPCGDWLILK